MTDEYKNYLQSAEWEQKKAQRLRIDRYRCAMCGKSARNTKIQCHHVTYRNVFNENIYTDLVSLCPGCHLKIHAYYDRVRYPVSDERG